jgi:hypothetical protein
LVPEATSIRQGCGPRRRRHARAPGPQSGGLYTRRRSRTSATASTAEKHSYSTTADRTKLPRRRGLDAGPASVRDRGNPGADWFVV